MTTRSLIGLYVATFLLQLGQGVAIPLLPVLVRNASPGAGAQLVGIAVAAFGLARLLASLPAGIAAGRLGPFWFIVAGPVLMAASLIGLASADTLPMIVAWRFVAGLSSALFVTASLIYLGDAVAPERRGSAYAYFYMAFSAGISAGPALGALLADVRGPSLPLIVVGCTSLASAALALAAVPRRRLCPPEPLPLGALSWSPWRDRRFIAIGLLSLLLYATRNGTQQTVVPTAAIATGLSLVTVGVGFTLAAVITSATGPVAAFMLDRFGRTRLMYLAAGILGITILGWIPGGHIAAPFLATMAAYGLVSALADSATVTVASEVAPASSRARSIGYFRLVSDVGYVLGPLVFGSIAGIVAPEAAIALNSLLLLGAGIAGIALFRRSRRLSC